MGRLVSIHHCPVCFYHVEDELHHGTSGISTFFLRNHYALAICKSCKNLVSVLVPSNEAQVDEALAAARSDLIQMEADAVIGDTRAREMLPFFREALDSFDSAEPGEKSQCTICGSTDLTVYDEITGELLDAQDAWVPCPRCDEGTLLIETSGSWD
jgi:hypothetical protein